MAAPFPPPFSARPNLSSRPSASLISPLALASPPPPFPPPPDPPPVLGSSSPLSPSSDLSPLNPPQPQVRWSSLFEAKPRSAGDFLPPTINLKYSGKSLIPTEDIVQASIEIWSDYLTGFFLDSPLSYTAVVTYLKNHWKPRGAVKVKSNGQMFFFLFSNAEDRKRILRADPVVIRNKVFIVKEWDVTMGNTGKGVKNVPIWVKFTDLPMVAWSKIGICWLATHVGKFLCMDRATESLEWLGYAKVMVEITPESELPNTISTILCDGTEHFIQVEYVWRPDVCSKCKSFGHCDDFCPSMKSTYNCKKSNLDRREIVVNAQASGRAVELNSQPKVAPIRSNARVSVQASAIQKQWQRVVGFNDKRSNVSRTQNSAIQTENSFQSLCEDQDANNDNRETEEGEITEPSLKRDEENGSDENNLGFTDRLKTDNNVVKMHNISEKGIEETGKNEVNNKDETAQTLSVENSEFMNIMNAGGYDVDVPLTEPTEQLNSDCIENAISHCSSQVQAPKHKNPMLQLFEDVRSFEETLTIGDSSEIAKTRSAECGHEDKYEQRNEVKDKEKEMNEVTQRGDDLTCQAKVVNSDEGEDMIGGAAVNCSVSSGSTKEDQENKVMTENEKAIQKTMAALQQLAREETPADALVSSQIQSDKHLSELTSALINYIDFFNDKLSEDLASEGNSLARSAHIQTKLNESTALRGSLGECVFSKEMILQFTAMIKKGIREHHNPTRTGQSQPDKALSSPPKAVVFPYANIAPPPGHKDRPPEVQTALAPSTSSERPITHITRSIKKEMMKNLKENG